MQRMIAPGKVNPLSNGPRRTQTMAPKNAASRLQVRTRRTALAISTFSDCDSSAACPFSEINLTPLVGMPKLHAELRTEIVELKRDSSPIPEGPRKSAVNLLRKLLQEFPILAHCQTILYISEYANNCFLLSPIIKRNKKGWISRKRNSTFIL